MRALLLIAGAALALGGCGSKAQNDNNQAAGESLTAENIVSNDVTAIDAVTGDAANMAADVDLNFGNLNETGDNKLVIASSKPARPAPKTSPPAETNTPAITAANSAANAE